ncbi:MAG: hypothetical protein OHK0012_21750 [Synechococcales cyanobacterium]
MASITSLIDEIKQFVIQKEKAHEYIGCDSSFGFWMIRSLDHISMTSRLGERLLIENLNDEELIQCTWQSLDQFLSPNEKRFDRLGENGLFFVDFDISYDQFNNCFGL